MSFPKTIPLFIFIILVCIQCKEKKTLKNPLSAPENWREETLNFPLSFAPSLNYRGAQYVRFAPGWGKMNSKEYFSYAFLWSLEDDPKLSSNSLESDLENYFDGLIKAVLGQKSDSIENAINAKVFIEKIDQHNYAGKILTFDPFTTQKEVSLNTVITYFPCKTMDRHLVFFRFSPQHINHSVWEKLNKLEISMDCN